MYAVVHYDNKVHGQSGFIVPKSPGSCILVPCRHGTVVAWDVAGIGARAFL